MLICKDWKIKSSADKIVAEFDSIYLTLVSFNAQSRCTVILLALTLRRTKRDPRNASTRLVA